jgi:elongation factor 2
VLPAITRAIWACILLSDYTLFEPKQKLSVSVPQDFMGSVNRVLAARRTQIERIDMEGDSCVVVGNIPVKSLIGLSQEMRGETQGRAIWTAEYAGYEKLPKSLLATTITEIRTRKGLEPDPKPAEFFFD